MIKGFWSCLAIWGKDSNVPLQKSTARTAHAPISYCYWKAIFLLLSNFLLKQKVQFSEGELDQTRSIANLRIHVERFMERIKNYHIFDRAFPISMTKRASDIFVIVCALVNFLPRLLSKAEF